MIYTDNELHKRLAKRYQGVKLQKLCAYWLLRVFDSLQPKEYSGKPNMVIEYENAWKQGKKTKQQFFEDNPEVSGYYYSCIDSKGFNEVKLKQLLDYKEYIQEAHKREEYALKIDRFRTVIANNKEKEVIPLLATAKETAKRKRSLEVGNEYVERYGL